MLQLFGFETVGVAISDLYFVDPDPNPGQETPERGVRLEVRLLERQPLHGSIYSAQPIGVGRPVWRADLLESVESAPGSYDRTHHHPAFDGWEPGRRNFVPELSADPLGWVAARLGDLPALLDEARIDRGLVDPSDAAKLRQSVPEIMDATRRLLGRVHAGELGVAPAGAASLKDARLGWL
ncbi:hypothetical protein K6U06_17660 [Acidiferrimicrobium sp. IK]|uniref:hypothetical protein n=1 Tax=Acidiferrimicrobium sp. IK TaxID=2871700 RepID=UPI0021CB6CD7|nr:hypothetical protein [Acidiferrimicrobium sp. IK]MCU4186197.1 hypothetical protein [Acidiferrimicrobium sp. IK]